MNKKMVRRGVAALAFAGAAVIGGQGVAHAQEEDYPPVLSVGGETPVEQPSSPNSPPVVAGTGGTLPQTGGPDSTSILLAAGAAVAAGVAITALANRRREDALEAV